MPALSGLGGDPKALTRLLADRSSDAEASDERGAPRAPMIPNDLEAAAIRLCPPVARLRDRIRALGDGTERGALAVGMSGSGPTVYGVFADEVEAERALEESCFESSVWARVARSLGEVPRVEIDRGARGALRG